MHRECRDRSASRGFGRVFTAVWLVLAVGFLGAAIWVTWTESHRITSTATVTDTGIHDSAGNDSFTVQFRTPSGAMAAALATTKDFEDQGRPIRLGGKVDVAYLPSSTSDVYVPGSHAGIGMIVAASFLLLFGIVFTYYDRTGRGPIALIFRGRSPA